MKIGIGGWPEAEAGDKYKDTIIPAHQSRTLALDTGEPMGLIWHYDAVIRDVVLANRLKGKVGDKGASDRNVSWHVNLMRTGERVWSVPALRGGRHVSGNKRMVRGKLRSGNRNLFAVELANAGHLHAVVIDGKRRFFASWKRDKDGTEKKSLGPDLKTEFAGDRVYGGHSGVHPQEAFTLAQQESAIELCNALLSRFPKLSRADLRYTHEMFDAPRKTDPGAAWMVAHLPYVMRAVKDPTPTGMEALAELDGLIQGLL